MVLRRRMHSAHDSLLRLSSLRAERSNPGQNTIFERSYGYDPASNITSDGQRDYAYDFMDRLTSASASSGVTLPNVSESFNYDRAGNRTTANGLMYSGNVLNQYLSVSGATNQAFQYDSNGNITDDGIQKYQYDYKNRLVHVYTGSTSIATYTYDILGRRILKTTPTETIQYIYSGDNSLQEVKTVNGRDFKKDYINGIDTDDLIAYDQEEMNLTSVEKPEYDFCVNRVLSFSGEFVQYGWTEVVNRCNELDTKASDKITNRYYFHTDHLRSVMGLTNNSGSIAIEYAYDAFGKTYVKSGSGGYTEVGSYKGNLYNNDRLYTGRGYDGEIGLYYYRARYYDPSTGRFVSRDPIGTSDQINLYTYVANNPLRFIDPSGKTKAVIIIWQEKTPWEFDAGALYQYEQYLKQWYKPKNIVGWYASTAEEFNALIHKYSNVGSVTFISHGTAKTLGADHNNPMIWEGNIQKLTPITNEHGNMCINTTVTVIACHAGQWENSIAQQTANRLDIPVTAPDAYIDIGTSEWVSRSFSFPWMFDSDRKSWQPTFYHVSNLWLWFPSLIQFNGNWNQFIPNKR